MSPGAARAPVWAPVAGVDGQAAHVKTPEPASLPATADDRHGNELAKKLGMTVWSKGWVPTRGRRRRTSCRSRRTSGRSRNETILPA
jgi:hypothetical protein